MKITTSPKMKNALLLLAALLFPFLALAIKVSSEASYELYKKIDGSGIPVPLRITSFIIFHFWGSWVAIYFTSFKKVIKIVFAVLYTIPMIGLVMFMSWVSICRYVVENCVMP